jgi:HD-GYP domain-containing protein (c-di-GMP phosphodiesterase class II)
MRILSWIVWSTLPMEELSMSPLEKIDELDRISQWMQLARKHDIFLHHHSLRVSQLSELFTAYLAVSPGDSERLVQAALLHDIGKTTISAALRRKPSDLTVGERLQLRVIPMPDFRS